MVLAALAACGSDEGALSPLALGDEHGGGDASAHEPVKQDAGLDAATDADADASHEPEDAAAPKRVVYHRNPFGNVAETKNLLWDGDFELSSPFSDQYGWLTGAPFSYSFTGARIGPECRSGIKCAALAKGKYLIGIGVAVRDAPLEASVWVRAPLASCAKVNVELMSLTGQADPDIKVPVVDEGADAAWCHYHVIAAPRATKTYLSIHNKSADIVIVDDAVLKAALPLQALTMAAGAPTAEEAASRAEVRAGIASLRGPHDPPPNEARRALEAWKR
jgi:hypothetical protein